MTNCISCGGPHTDTADALAAAQAHTWDPRAIRVISEMLDAADVTGPSFEERLAYATDAACIDRLHGITAVILGATEDGWRPFLFQWQPVPVIEIAVP